MHSLLFELGGTAIMRTTIDQLLVHRIKQGGFLPTKDPTKLAAE
jgi:hypothetical protein